MMYYQVLGFQFKTLGMQNECQPLGCGHDFVVYLFSFCPDNCWTLLITHSVVLIFFSILFLLSAASLSELFAEKDCLLC